MNLVLKFWGVRLSRKDSEFYLNEIKKCNEFPKLNELIGILESLGANEDFIDIAGKKYDEDDFDWDFRKTPFYEGAYEGLDFINQTKEFNPEFIRKIADAYSISNLLDMVRSSMIHHSNASLSIEDEKAIVLSPLLEYLTFYLEDFQNPDNKVKYRGYEDFFITLKDLSFENRETKIFFKNVSYFLNKLTAENNLNVQFIVSLNGAAKYLSGCSALKGDSDSASIDDVACGYLCVFKILFTDLKDYIYSIYDGERWVKESTWKVDSREIDNMMIINRNLCKIIAVIFFCEMIVVIGFVIQFFYPGFHFTGHQLIRMTMLLGSFVITALFYNYIAADKEIVKGKDKGMFLIKGKIDYLKLIIIIIVIGAFLWVMIPFTISLLQL